MFYEVRCGDLIKPGTHYERFDRPPKPGDDVYIGSLHFGVHEIRSESARRIPIVELFTW